MGYRLLTPRREVSQQSVPLVTNTWQPTKKAPALDNLHYCCASECFETTCQSYCFYTVSPWSPVQSRRWIAAEWRHAAWRHNADVIDLLWRHFAWAHSKHPGQLQALPKRLMCNTWAYDVRKLEVEMKYVNLKYASFTQTKKFFKNLKEH